MNIDSNTLYTASNIMVQAGYIIKQAPSTVPVVYTGLATAVITACLSILAVIAAAGRALAAWKSGHKALPSILSGTKVPIVKPTTVVPPPAS